MARVDLLISNDRHHWAMVWPVVEALAGSDRDRWRVLSLCELRGLRSPEAAPRGVEIRPVMPFRLPRSPSTGGAPKGGGAGAARGALRALAWRTLIAPRLGTLLSERPDLVVLPNDLAYPYDRIVDRLHRLAVPFLLLQEGIRFPLPAESGGAVYGGGGAVAVAAWGSASGEYFRSAGVPAERIHLTGCPRFDSFHPPRNADERRRARSHLGLPQRTLALISNPIDDQGFCSREAKMALFDRFLSGIGPFFEDPEFHLAVKLHSRESTADFEDRIPGGLRSRVSVLGGVALTDLFLASRAAVVLASTVGLEALLCGLPLAVLEIPGHGFQYDYVQSGTALGLTWSAPLAPQVAALLGPSAEPPPRVESYLQSQLASRTDASQRVARLIRNLVAEHR